MARGLSGWIRHSPFLTEPTVFIKESDPKTKSGVGGVTGSGCTVARLGEGILASRGILVLHRDGFLGSNGSGTAYRLCRVVWAVGPGINYLTSLILTFL